MYVHVLFHWLLYTAMATLVLFVHVPLIGCCIGVRTWLYVTCDAILVIIIQPNTKDNKEFGLNMS